MKIKASTIAMTLALSVLPHTVNAAGLGKITVLSVLGQPLRAEVDVTASREEIASLAGRIAPNESFRQAGIEYVSALSDIRISVAKRTDGRPYLLLKSNRAINEAFIDLLLELNWDGGRLQREYTFLLDPPELLQPSQSTRAAQPAASPNESSAKPAPSNTPATPASPPSAEEKPASDMKAMRDASGASRIVKADRPAPPPVQKTQEATRQAYQVKRGDTLSKIAQSNLPEGASLDQMLVALFRSNKDAFEDGNINRLKTGRILALPDQAAINSIDPQEARRIIVAQSADFNAYRKKLAAATETAAPEQEEAPQQATRGKIEPRLKEPAAPPAATKDKLEISKSATTKDAREKDLAARAAAIEEDIIAREKSLKEANSRIAELDKSLADMKKLLELKNKSLADTQNQAAGTSAPAASVKSSEKQPTPDMSAEKPAEKSAEPAEKAIEPASPQGQPAATATPEPARKIAPAQAHAPSPAPAPAPSFIDENPEVLYGGGGILALILGYLGFKTWRKRKDEQESHSFQDHDLSMPSSFSPRAQTESSVDSVFGSTGGQVVDTLGAAASIAPASIDTDFSLASAGTNDTHEKVDPIAEADVYMAYGRTEQAEEILLDALKNDPTRYALHLKLLDIYAVRKALKPFENIARELHTQTDGNGPEWAQAAQLGRTIDPGNTLYAGNAASDTPPPKEPRPYDPTATMVMTPRDIDKIAAANAPLAAPLSEESTESLDFELDLGGDSIQTDAPDSTDSVASDAQEFQRTSEALAASETSSPAEASPPQISDDIIDFELDFPAPAETSQASESEFAIASALAPEATPTSEPLLELPAIQATGTDAPFIPKEQPIISDADTTKSPSDIDDLEFDLGELENFGAQGNTADQATETASSTPGDALSPKAPHIDLSAISLDLDDTATLSLPPSHTRHTPSSETASGNEPTLKLEKPLVLEMPALEEAPTASTESHVQTATAAVEAPLEDDTPGSPEVDTKLELANAYEEMGDHEGARELLQEVLNEGNARQKAIAQGKLSQLG